MIKANKNQLRIFTMAACVLFWLGAGLQVKAQDIEEYNQPEYPPNNSGGFDNKNNNDNNDVSGNISVSETSRGQSHPVAKDVNLDVLDLKNMDILDVLKLISQKSGVNIVASQEVKGKVTVYLKNVTVQEALTIIVEAYGWAYDQDEDIIKVMPAKNYEDKYGHRFGQPMSTLIKQLLYARSSELSTVLTQIKSVSGKIIVDDKSNSLILLDEPEILTRMEELIQRLDVPMKTQVFQLSYGKAKDISDKITEMLTPTTGKMKFDERSNKIMVSDTAIKVDEITKMVQAFDQKDQEVLIEAKILQIVLDDETKLGVDWEAIVQDYKRLDLASDFDVLGSTDKRGKLSVGTLSSDDFTVLIESLETVGVTNILSSPRIAAMNEKEAKILVGSTEPYVTTTTTTPASGPTTTAESVNFIEVGVKLFVTPTIHQDRFITMKIKPEVSTVVSNLTTSQNNTIPVVETSQAETTVMVKDGMTIVIGGLIKEEKVNTTKKVPFLGDIPVLGYAFKNKSDSVKKTEIAIFLTPHIMTGDAEVEKELTDVNEDQ